MKVLEKRHAPDYFERKKANDMPCVFVILLNWNGWRDTVRCVHSCRRLHYPNFRILIVDNDSADGSETILRNYFPNIDFIQSGANLGFAGGNNVGIRYALQEGADYVWLLNNDAVADTDSLMQLVKVVQSDPQVGIVGSKIYYCDPPDVVWFAGGMNNWRTGYSIHLGESQLDGTSYNLMREVDYICGCSLLIGKEVLSRVGLMEEKYFLYIEDSDWNERVRQNGYKVVYVPQSLVWHRISRSIGKQSRIYYYYLMRNSLLFVWRYRPVLFLWIAVRRLAEIVDLYRQGKKEGAKASLLGVKDFFVGRFGERKF